jgi:hypothetical protein
MTSMVGQVRHSRYLVALFVVGTLVSTASAVAEPATLEGTWSGGGTVVYPSGERERARCRATFTRRSANRFNMNAICATPSARVAQTAVLARASDNRFTGEFFNPEYSVSGAIAITVRGNSLNASLNGGGGTGYFNLSR